MTQPIAASRPLLTMRNLAVAVTFIAVALLLWLVAAKTGQSARTATFTTPVHHIYNPCAISASAPPSGCRTR